MTKNEQITALRAELAEAKREAREWMCRYGDMRDIVVDLVDAWSRGKKDPVAKADLIKLILEGN